MARRSKAEDKAYWDKWYAAHREERLEKMRNSGTKEEKRKAARLWREKNREKYNAYHRWYQRKKREEKQKLDETNQV